jgi:hypothetical protein
VLARPTNGGWTLSRVVGAPLDGLYDFAREGDIVLFLSYAEEDREVAAEVADWLTRLGQQVYRWRDPEHEELTIEGIEEQISQADDYIALFSPDFLASVLCRREREMATCREQGLQVSDPEARFFHVLQVRNTEDSADGFPPRPQWVDLTDLQNKEAALHHLASRLGSGARARSSDAGPAGAGRGSLFFRNRSDELDLVGQPQLVTWAG